MRNAATVTYIAYIYATGITITENRVAGVCGPIRELDRPEGPFQVAALAEIFRAEGFEIDGELTFEAMAPDGFRMEAKLNKINRPYRLPHTIGA